MYSQEGKEHNCFDAQELSNGFHRLQFIFICLIEEHQAIHGNELRKVVDSNHVRECYIYLELTLVVHTCQLTDTTHRHAPLIKVTELKSHMCTNTIVCNTGITEINSH